jgi:hypothetical protein
VTIAKGIVVKLIGSAWRVLRQAQHEEILVAIGRNATPELLILSQLKDV